MKSTTAFLATVLALAAAARADSLTLTPLATIDLSALPLVSLGDLAYDVGGNKLWVSDGANGGLLYELNGITGALLATQDLSVVPGLTGGPDALA